MTSYGTYTATMLGERPAWSLKLQPAVRMRARRLFGRIQLSRSEEIVVADTPEVCRDLEWFMTRYPLSPVTDNDSARLTDRAAGHAATEQLVATITAGQHQRGELPRTPAKTARDYQVTAIDLLRARGRILLTDEVGLGKTFTGLLSLVHDDALPAVIVPPTHLPPRWETELTEAFPWLTFATAKKTTPPPNYTLPDVMIVPYSKIDGWAAYLQPHAATVIFDEAQELRTGAGTLKGAAAALLSSTATYVIGLTATPVYNYGGEIWNIYDILAPGELGTREEFAREWGMPKVNEPAALGAWLRDSGLMLGRTRTQVGRELPKTIKVPHQIETDYVALRDVEVEAKALAEKILGTEATPQERWQAAGEIDWRLRKATGVDKARYVADFVKVLLEAEQRIVLFGWHRDVYDIWLAALADFHPRLYTGTETPTQKRAAELAFTTPWEDNNADQCRLLIMSLRSGAGVDGLQKVSRVAVFGELDWSPQVHEQAIGRLRRDGMSDDPPVAYFLHSSEGTDPLMLDILQLKRQQSEPIVSADGKLLGNSVQDVNRGQLIARKLLGLTPEGPNA